MSIDFSSLEPASAKDKTLIPRGKSGLVWVAPLGTAQPDGLMVAGPPIAAVPVPVAFQSVGYISEDGIEWGIDEDREETLALQSASPLYNDPTRRVRSFTFTPLETGNPTVLGLIEPNSTLTQRPAGDYELVPGQLQSDERAWVVDLLMGDWVWRWTIPNGEVTERGGAQYQRGTPFAHELTLTPTDGPDGTPYRLYTAGRTLVLT